MVHGRIQDGTRGEIRDYWFESPILNSARTNPIHLSGRSIYHRYLRLIKPQERDEGC